MVKLNIVILILFLNFQYVSNSQHFDSSSDNSTLGSGSNETKYSKKHGKGIHIFKFDPGPVETPIIVCVWVLVASLAKIVFHRYAWLSSTIPESCLLILLGIPIGFALREAGASGAQEGAVHLTSSLFFFFLLPPIILDAGYFMTSEIFYMNIGTILLYAVFGTIFNTFAVGVSMFGVSHVCEVNITLLQSLLFGSLISAVDPVAVLAVFEEVHVNEILYMLVFGESVLNDAASVVLYRTFESLSDSEITAEQIWLAFASFFVVSIGGTIIGVVFALAASFITKFTDHVLVIEPVFVFLISYLAYLCAEVFHFSGIMSILFCGIVMKPYVESNVSRKSHTTIKYFLKLLSSSCESIIFMFLGVALVQYHHKFNFSFIMFTLLFITIYRAVGITMLTGFANRFGRLSKVKRVEQFIMSYGGLRGAVAFCLAILLKDDEDSSQLKNTLVTTTISVVIFTVFVQGCTIKKLVDVLGVKKSQKRDKSMGETLNERVLSYMVAGVEEIIGVHGHGFWMNMLELFNRKYLRRWLARDPDLALDEELILTQRRIAFKTALSYADKPQEIADREQDGVELAAIKTNASTAMQFAMKALQAPGYDGGFLDVGVLNASVGLDDSEGANHFSEAFNPRVIASIIPKAKTGLKRRTSTRKYTLDSLEEGNNHARDRDRRIHLEKVVIASYKHQSSRKSRQGRHRNGKSFEGGESEERHKRHHHHHRNSSKTLENADTKKDYIEIQMSELESAEVEDNVQSLDDHDSHNGHFNDSRKHKHKHHHSSSKKKHKNHRKESEILPQVTNAEDTIRDVKCTYDFPLKSGDYQNKNTPDASNSELYDDHYDATDSDNLVHKEYMPNLPDYNFSPSKQFSPYADTPLLDRSNKTMTERDQEVLNEAHRKHSSVKDVPSMKNSPHIGVQDKPRESPSDSPPPYDPSLDIIDPWASPPLIIVDHHINDDHRLDPNA